MQNLDELPPVLAFNPELLPRQLRGWVLDIAERMNCPIDLVAIPAMVSGLRRTSQAPGSNTRESWAGTCGTIKGRTYEHAVERASADRPDVHFQSGKG